jgi:hypothetical protein
MSKRELNDFTDEEQEHFIHSLWRDKQYESEKQHKLGNMMRYEQLSREMYMLGGTSKLVKKAHELERKIKEATKALAT